MPFVWGSNDCCLGAAWVYLTLYGKDYGSEFRGYTSALGAYRMLKKHGGMKNILTKLGFVEVPMNFGQRGNIVIYTNNKHGEAMGVLIDNYGLFAGNVMVPRKLLQSAFRIG
jgi:hypothetical protein